MDNRSIRENLLVIFKEQRGFNPSLYYYFTEITSNNLFLRSVFEKREKKLSFLDNQNKSYQNQNYNSDSVIILENTSLYNKRKKEELLRTFFFLERLLTEEYIELDHCRLILEGNLTKVCEEVSLLAKKQIYSFYKIVEKQYLFKLPLLKTAEEVVLEVKKLESKLSTFFKEEVKVRYKSPNKWFIKKGISHKEENSLLSSLKEYLI